MGKLFGILFSLVIVAAVAAGAGWFWLNSAFTAEGPATPDGTPRVVMIERGSGAQAIATTLKEAGAIADDSQFRLALRVREVLGDKPVMKAGELPDRMISMATSRLAARAVSGETVIVALDDKTLQAIGNQDFDIKHHMALVRAIDASPAKRLFIDFSYGRRVTDREFPEFAAAVRDMGNRIVLAVPSASFEGTTATTPQWPDPRLGIQAPRGFIGWEYEFWQVWKVPLAVHAEGRTLPSFAALLANRPLDEPSKFALDLSYDPDTITQYSAIDVLTGKLDPQLLRGKDVIFAPA